MNFDRISITDSGSKFINVKIFDRSKCWNFACKHEPNANKESRGAAVLFHGLPLNGPRQLLKNTRNLLRYSRNGSITIPTVMILTSDDKTISLETSVKPFKTLFSGDKKLIWLQSDDKSAAAIPKGIVKDQLIVPNHVPKFLPLTITE